MTTLQSDCTCLRLQSIEPTLTAVDSLSLSVFQETQFSGMKAESQSPGGLHRVVEEQDGSPSKLSKEELIQSMDRVDREIAKVEQQIFKLKKKQVV